jgi:hypothetical protein
MVLVNGRSLFSSLQYLLISEKCKGEFSRQFLFRNGAGSLQEGKKP